MLFYPGGGGYPIHGRGGTHPEYPPSWPGQGGTPSQAPPVLTWLRVPHPGYPHPDMDMGPVEVLWDGDGYPTGCEQTENITFAILRMRAVKVIAAKAAI